MLCTRCLLQWLWCIQTQSVLDAICCAGCLLLLLLLVLLQG